jgi:hypothetical protein
MAAGYRRAGPSGRPQLNRSAPTINLPINELYPVEFSNRLKKVYLAAIQSISNLLLWVSRNGSYQIPRAFASGQAFLRGDELIHPVPFAAAEPSSDLIRFVTLF